MTFREYLLEQVHLEKYIPLIKEIVKDVIDSCKENEFDPEADFIIRVCRKPILTQDKEKLFINVYLEFVDKLTSQGAARIIGDDGEIKLFIDKEMFDLLVDDDYETNKRLQTTLTHEFTHILDPYMRKIGQEKRNKRDNNKKKVKVGEIGNDEETKKFYGIDPIEIKAIISEYVYDIIDDWEDDELYERLLKGKNIRGLELFYNQKLKEIDFEHLKEYTKFYKNPKLLKLIISALHKTINRKIEYLRNKK